jgi:hypothetical protein
LAKTAAVFGVSIGADGRLGGGEGGYSISCFMARNFWLYAVEIGIKVDKLSRHFILKMTNSLTLRHSGASRQHRSLRQPAVA